MIDRLGSGSCARGTFARGGLVLIAEALRRQTLFDGITTIIAQSGHLGIVAPDGGESAPATKLQPDGTLVKALARAWRWQRMLDEGRFASVRELAEAKRVGLSYVSRILRLTLLAPDIVERIIEGRPAPQLAELMQRFPVEWERQRSGCATEPQVATPRREHSTPDSRL